jgi:hypothetical protein
MSTTVIADVLQPSPNNDTIVIPHNVTVSGNLLVSGTSSITETVEAVPTAVKTALPTVTPAGKLLYVSNATGLHVTGSLCFSNGTSWIDVTTGVAVV